MRRNVSALWALLFCVFSAYGSGLVDPKGSFTEEQASQINLLCEELESKHFISTLIYMYQGEEPKLSKTSRSAFGFLFVKIDLEAKRLGVSTINLGPHEQAEYEEVFNRLVGYPLQNSKPIHESLMLALETVIQKKELAKRHLERAYEIQQAKRRFSPALKVHLWTYFYLIVWFAVYYTFKSLKKGNRFENVEFYGLSRLSTIGAFILGFVVFGVGVSVIATLPEHEQFISLVGFVFAFYPLLILAAGIPIVFLDLKQVLLFSTAPKAELSLGARFFLLNPKVPTEFLLEVNFYQLLVDKALELQFDAYYRYDRMVTDYYVVLNQPPPGVPDALKVFFQRQKGQPMGLGPYLKLVYKSFGRFKAYRKDYIIRELHTAGLVSRWGWLINRFTLTSEGKKEKLRVKKQVYDQKALLQQALSADSDLKELVRSFTKDLLICPRLEEDFYTLRQKLANLELLAWAQSLELGIFFCESFDFLEFNRRLHRAYYYKMEWSKTADVTEWI